MGMREMREMRGMRIINAVYNFFLAPFLRGLGDLKFESYHAKILPSPPYKGVYYPP
jgi:hypothetical protein